MPEKKLAAFVEASGPPSEPAARRTCQPATASAPLSARVTCAEPPRGKKNSAEQTRPASGPIRRAGRAPFSPAPRSPIPLRFGRGAGDSSPEPRNGSDKRKEAPVTAATSRTRLPPAGRWPTDRREAVVLRGELQVIDDPSAGRLVAQIGHDAARRAPTCRRAGSSRCRWRANRCSSTFRESWSPCRATPSPSCSRTLVGE